MNSNLTKLTVFGILWTGISRLSTQLFRFVIIVILARLLTPEDFGIVGLAAIFLGFITTINELGLSAAIIQRKEIDEIHLSTTFWASVIMAIILFIIVILASPFVADFFQEDIVQPILIVTSIGLIIGTFTVVHHALLEKSLSFKKIAIAEVCAAVVSGMVSVFFAFSGYGVWSLVFGGLAGSFISVVILWRIVAWRPELRFSFARFKELFGFGSHVMGSRVLNYIDSNMDYLVVGKLLGTSALGYYSFAYHLMMFPLNRVSTMVTRVTFPAFSTIQDDNETLRKGYLKVVRYISLITFPMLAGMFVVAPEFVVVVYGAKWAPMILPLQILCLAGALKAVGTTVGSVLLSKGRADIQFKWNVFTAIVVPIAVILGANYGIAGVAAAITVMTVLLFPIIQMITNKLIDLTMFSYFKAIFPAIIGSITLIIFVVAYQRMSLTIYGLPDISMLISSALIGIVVYILLMRIVFNDLLKELRSLIHKIRE
jgi:O-antigen/teichoic acid export membrane protein